MRSKLPLISAVCVLSASACAHVQSTEAEAPATEQTMAAATTTPTTPTTVDGTKVEGTFASSPVAAPSQEVEGVTPAAAQAQPQAVRDPLVGVPATGQQAEQAAHAGADENPTAEGEPIGRFVLTRGIEDREPVDTSEAFRPGEKVYAFLDVANPDGGEYALNLRWEYDDGAVGEPVAVTIGTSPHWRTWSWRRAPEKPGSEPPKVEKKPWWKIFG